MAARKTYHVTFEVTFDSEEVDTFGFTNKFGGTEEFEELDESRVLEAVNTGFEYEAEAFFGESLSMLGMLTPSVIKVKEIS